MNEKEFEEIRKQFKLIEKRDEENSENFWNSLSYEDKCNAFQAVVSLLS